MYTIRSIDNPAEWEQFVKNQLYTLFVQSVHYGEFYTSLGESAWNIGIFTASNQLIGGSLVVTTTARRGKFLYLPYGPIFMESLPVEERGIAFAALIQHLRELAKKEHCRFVRSSPFTIDSVDERTLYKKNGLRPAPMHILAEDTWLLDITPSTEEILRQMNKNHRNLIRRCEKEGVKVTTGTPDTFHKLLDVTTARHRFHRFSRSYIDKEFQAFTATNEVVLWQSTLPTGEVDASAIVIYYGSMACYRHGASLGLDKRLPSSYLLQWEAILEAKRRGCRWYNFWGIAPPDAGPKHPFFGITHFKKGFGGEERQLLPCHDLPISPWYWINWTIETLRRLWRGFF